MLNVDLNDDSHVLAFRNAKPYPHLVLDDFFDRKAADDFFERSKRLEKWVDTHTHCDNPKIANRLVADYSDISRELKVLVEFFQGSQILSFVSKLLGVDVFCDPGQLRGGGLQRAVDGAFLNVHLDNCWNPKLEAWTVANSLYYLSTDWREEFNGHLELWDQTKCVKKIPPTRNTCVICINNDVSYHGYPQPVQTNDDKSYRQALVIFYYSKTSLSATPSGACSPTKREGALWVG